MALNTLDALFEETLRDMYYAEKKLTRILPKMAKKVSSEELADAFTSHAEETQGHVDRIEKIFAMLDKPPAPRNARPWKDSPRKANM